MIKNDNDSHGTSFFFFFYIYTLVFLHQQAVDGGNEVQVIPVCKINISSVVQFSQSTFDQQPARSLESCSSSESVSTVNRLYWPDKERKQGVAISPSQEMMASHNQLLVFGSTARFFLSHLDDHGVFPMFGLICKVWFLCASVPNQHLKKRRRRIKNDADSANAGY